MTNVRYSVFTAIAKALEADLEAKARAAVGTITMNARLYSDSKCTPHNSFKNITNAPVPLGNCSFSAEDVASVRYECVEGSKLHFRLFLGKNTCNGDPSQEVTISYNSCAVLGTLASGQIGRASCRERV